MADPTQRILEATRRCLLRTGYAGLSTRQIAREADIALGHIHYRFTSKRNVVLALLDEENTRRLERQQGMYESDAPLWKQWEQACDFLEDDLASGYVRVLHEMIAAGWSEPDIAERVRAMLEGWYELLRDVAARAAGENGSLGPFSAEEAAALTVDAFLGAEAMLLLGTPEDRVPRRAALRRVGELIRIAEEHTSD